MIIYQIIQRLWGSGKLSAADTPFFNHIKSLGVTHIWYTGLLEHSTGKDFVKGNPGSPYAIRNHYDINEYLAEEPGNRMDEFEALITRTHEAGLKIIIDFIPNHVGRDYEGSIPHFDYSDYDWTDTLKIDYFDNRSWDEMLNVLRFWAAKGVDGFRCDMVELVPKSFLKWLISSLKAEFPNLAFIAEVYRREGYREYVEDVGFDLLYDKSGLYDALLALHECRGTAKAITWNWQYLGDLQSRMLNFIENHDEIRFNNWAALYVSMLLNKAAFMIYFGEEIGEDASTEANRRTSIFEWKHYPSLERLCRHIHGEDALEKEEADCLERFREMAAYAILPAFKSGLTYDLCYVNGEGQGFDPDKHFAFLRSDGVDTYLVICNFADEEANIQVNIPEHATQYLGIDGRLTAPLLKIKGRDGIVVKLA